MLGSKGVWLWRLHCTRNQLPLSSGETRVVSSHILGSYLKYSLDTTKMLNASCVLIKRNVVNAELSICVNGI